MVLVKKLFSKSLESLFFLYTNNYNLDSYLNLVQRYRIFAFSKLYHLKFGEVCVWLHTQQTCRIICAPF